MRRLLDADVRKGILLDKATVTLYEAIQEFWIAELDDNGEVVGCGALHVMWEDLCEVRAAVKPGLKGAGVGHRLMEKLLQTARRLGVRRVFCLTFEVEFFGKHGFVEIGETPVDGDVYAKCCVPMTRVSEFPVLERVKPNTLATAGCFCICDRRRSVPDALRRRSRCAASRHIPYCFRTVGLAGFPMSETRTFPGCVRQWVRPRGLCFSGKSGLFPTYCGVVHITGDGDTADAVTPRP
ncbi:Amino-acid acetyltransferase [Streptomyces hirsutus]